MPDRQEPSLAIVIHSEEEFDWNNGFYRSNNTVTHGKELISLSERLLAIGAKITFALDYAFVTNAGGKAVIEHFLPKINNSIEFAAHLHPWINPPFETNENKVKEQFSYPGNLDKKMEREKLKVLTSTIEEITGQKPTSYLAGRYGIGENTADILRDLGYSVDLSISPFADFSIQQGPDFSLYNNSTFVKNGIYNLPHTCGFVSHIPALSKYINNHAEQFKKLNNSLLSKILFRLSGVKKYRLSPEGYSLNEMKQLTRSLQAIDLKYFVFSFHSPSVKLGLTPYVRNTEQLDEFINNTIKYLTWFNDELSGKCILAKNATNINRHSE